MIIWKGYGILVIVIAAVACAIIGNIFKGMGGSQDVGMAIGAMLSGILIWFVGKKFNAPEKTQVYIDKKSGQEVLVKPDHSLFFIKMQYWAFVVVAIGGYMLLDMFTKK